MFDVHFLVNPSNGQFHFLLMMNPAPLAVRLNSKILIFWKHVVRKMALRVKYVYQEHICMISCGRLSVNKLLR